MNSIPASMNSTSDSANGPSRDFDGSYAYSSVGSYFVILAVIALISLTLYYCSRKYLETRQNRVTANTSTELTGSAITIQIHEREATHVSNYPVLLYSEAKQQKPDSATITPCCSICLLDYKDTDWMRLLPDCGHFFHRDCIDIWLRLNLSCPVCRTSPLPTPLAEVAPLATRRSRN